MKINASSLKKPVRKVEKGGSAFPQAPEGHTLQCTLPKMVARVSKNQPRMASLERRPGQRGAGRVRSPEPPRVGSLQPGASRGGRALGDGRALGGRAIGVVPRPW